MTMNGSYVAGDTTRGAAARLMARAPSVASNTRVARPFIPHRAQPAHGRRMPACVYVHC